MRMREEYNESGEDVRKRREKYKRKAREEMRDFRRGFEKLNFATQLLVILAGSQDFPYRSGLLPGTNSRVEQL